MLRNNSFHIRCWNMPGTGTEGLSYNCMKCLQFIQNNNIAHKIIIRNKSPTHLFNQRKPTLCDMSYRLSRIYFYHHPTLNFAKCIFLILNEYIYSPVLRMNYLSRPDFVIKNSTSVYSVWIKFYCGAGWNLTSGIAALFYSNLRIGHFVFLHASLTVHFAD